jgi:hypothetical protein
MHTKQNTMSRSITLGTALIAGGMAATAQAAVVKWDVNVPLTAGGHYFDIFNKQYSTETNENWSLGIGMAPDAGGTPGFLGVTGGNNFNYITFAMSGETEVANLTAGSYVSGSNVDYYSYAYGPYVLGSNFNLNSSDNYIGFGIFGYQSGIGAVLKYGWAQIQVFGSINDPNNRVLSIGYETNAYQAVQIQPYVAVPGPAATTLLAVAGLVGSRRRRA